MNIIREILVLINEDMHRACTELKKFFEKKGEGYGLLMDYQGELLSEPANSQNQGFRRKLRLFVDHYKDHIRTVHQDQTQNKREGVSNTKDQVYSLLCELNFSHQKEYFDAALNSNKSLIPFMIQGDGNYGQEWLYNRLIHQFANENLVHQTVVLDFSPSSGIGNAEDVLDHLANKLKCEDYDISDSVFDKKFALIDVIREKIKSGTQFIVFKNAHKFLSSSHFSELYQFMTSLSKKLDTWNKKPTSENHQCICFFVDDKACNYTIAHCLPTEGQRKMAIKKHKGVKFIILKQIQPISVEDLDNWLAGITKGGEIFHCIEDKLDALLKKSPCKSPVNLITLICEEIGKDYEECKGQWLTHT